MKFLLSILMAGNWTRWPETGQLTSFAKNGIISLVLEVGSLSPYILKVSKWTVSCRKMRKFLCINKRLGRLQTKVAGNWATYCIGYAIKQHAETTGHDIHPKYVNILETGVKTWNKKIFPESLHSFLEKSSGNERAPSPRVYTSLVSSLTIGSNQQWRLFLYIIFAFRDLLSTFLWRRPWKAAENLALKENGRR